VRRPAPSERCSPVDEPDVTFSLAGVLAGSLAMGTAGILRGFTGFGTALAGVPLLSLVFAPRLAVPTIMALQIATGLQNLHADGRHVEWRTLLRLLPGAVVGIVPGLWLLLWLSADAARLAIGLIVVLTSLLLQRGWRLERLPGTGGLLALGVLSGVLNGLAAIAGPPVIALFFALRRSPEVTRASLAAFFLCNGVLGLSLALGKGLIAPGELWLAALLCPAMILGTTLGGRLFTGDLKRHYRLVGLVALLAVGLAAAARGAIGLWLG